MGSMQTESLGRVDDNSRFTWVRFLRGKADTIKVCFFSYFLS